MSLRSELEAMLEEFEHFAYDGAPLYTATEKVREILAATEPKALTTVEASSTTASDPRLAPAVNAFRKEMYRRGVKTSISNVHASMIEALAAADEATSKAHGL